MSQPAAPVAATEAASPFDHLSHRAAAVVLEAALSGRPDVWEPDGSEVTRSAMDDWTVEWEAPADGLPEFVSARAATAKAPSEPPEPEPQIEAGRIEVDAAPPVVPADTVAEPEQSQPDPVMPETEARLHLTDEGEPSVIDEEVLREMIRDVLRDELQGTLGERITRNVRKLVRAEIARALSAREFD